MLVTAHALLGGALAGKFSDPITASALAFSSHFLLDSIPHWDFGSDWRSRLKPVTGILAIAETFLGLGLAYFLFRSQVPNALLWPTLIAAVLPDWLETPWYIFFAQPHKPKPRVTASFWEKISFRIYKTENIFHAKMGLPWGLLTQVATIVFFLFLLK